MARTTQPNPPQAHQTPRTPLTPIRLISCVLLALIVLIGLAILITWLVIRPKHLVYSIENGSVSNFHQADYHLNSTFYFTIRAYNPNRRVSVYYDSIETSVSYGGQSVAYDSTIKPFFQGHKNETRFDSKLVAWNVALSGINARNLRLEKGTGEVELEVHIKARIRYKVGIWKSAHKKIKLNCYPVMVPFSSTKHFEPIECDSD